jgi:heme-degrading monooxygenase HmoA
MIAILWTYDVRPEAADLFERGYGPAGAWVALFRRAEGYLGTELLRGPASSYLTIDRWRSRGDFEAFMAACRDEYEAIDRATERLTVTERRLGEWEAVSST